MVNFRNSSKLVFVGVISSLATAALIYGEARAQDGQPGQPGSGGMMGGRSGMGGGMGMQMPPQMMMQPVTMAVDGDSVFVAQGMTVYKLNRSNLHVSAHADLHPPRPMGQGGMDNGRQQQPPMPHDGGGEK